MITINITGKKAVRSSIAAQIIQKKGWSSSIQVYTDKRGVYDDVKPSLKYNVVCIDIEKILNFKQTTDNNVDYLIVVSETPVPWAPDVVIATDLDTALQCLAFHHQHQERLEEIFHQPNQYVLFDVPVTTIQPYLYVPGVPDVNNIDMKFLTKKAVIKSTPIPFVAIPHIIPDAPVKRSRKIPAVLYLADRPDKRELENFVLRNIYHTDLEINLTTNNQNDDNILIISNAVVTGSNAIMDEIRKHITTI